MPSPVIAVPLLCLVFLLQAATAGADAIVADHTVVSQFELIPDSVVENVKNDLVMFYGHTSHGSQIVTGMQMVREEDPFFDFNNGAGTFQFSEYGDDLGHNGDTTWVPITRARLDQPGNDINVVMWSWCGGCSDNTEEGINIYLNAMNGLEQQYPDVMFVYMTGHLNGTGPEGNLYARNNQIRDYCVANGKVLFDFADIESYDPDGTWYPYGGDGCEWCYTWCSTHTCPDCDHCAHSHCFNCYLKGKVFWWMLGASVAGMSAGVDGDGLEIAVPALAQNRPNPFNPTTDISFTLSEPSTVVLEIYNMAGQRVTTLLDRRFTAGDHAIRWDGADASGRPVAAGSYFYRLQAGDSVDTKKMVLVK